MPDCIHHYCRNYGSALDTVFFVIVYSIFNFGFASTRTNVTSIQRLARFNLRTHVAFYNSHNISLQLINSFLGMNIILLKSNHAYRDQYVTISTVWTRKTCKAHVFNQKEYLSWVERTKEIKWLDLKEKCLLGSDTTHYELLNFTSGTLLYIISAGVPWNLPASKMSHFIALLHCFNNYRRWKNLKMLKNY